MSIVEYMKQRGTNFNYDKVIYLSHGYGGNITNLNDITLKFKGSSNQRLVDVPKSLERGEVVLYE